MQEYLDDRNCGAVVVYPYAGCNQLGGYVLPQINPVDEEYLQRGAPVDHLGDEQFDCPNCQVEVAAGRFRTIFGTYGGVGVPFFVKPFLKHVSTRGKIGTKSEWLLCQTCRCFVPGDRKAQDWAASVGLPDGFGMDL